jgi:hypothetical protein
MLVHHTPEGADGGGGDETCPVSTGEGTRRVQLVRGRDDSQSQGDGDGEEKSAPEARGAGERGGAPGYARWLARPPPSRTKWTRRVPHPVLIGHAASLAPY